MLHASPKGLMRDDVRSAAGAAARPAARPAGWRLWPAAAGWWIRPATRAGATRTGSVRAAAAVRPAAGPVPAARSVPAAGPVRRRGEAGLRLQQGESPRLGHRRSWTADLHLLV